jgi:Ca2+-binding EF-hand superfamily protein
MPMTDARKLDVEEAFEIVGKKEANVNKDTMGMILRSLGLNPTNDEITELFSAVSAGGTVDCAGVVKAAETFDATVAGRNVKEDTTSAFAVFDKEATGKISAACVLLQPPATAGAAASCG